MGDRLRVYLKNHQDSLLYIIAAARVFPGVLQRARLILVRRAGIAPGRKHMLPCPDNDQTGMGCPAIMSMMKNMGKGADACSGPSHTSMLESLLDDA